MTSNSFFGMGGRVIGKGITDDAGDFRDITAGKVANTHSRILLQRANRLNDLVLFRETTGLLLRIHRFTVRNDFKNAAAALDQLDFGAELFL